MNTDDADGPDVNEQAHLLRTYATHFGIHDWNYTRDLGDLIEVRYDTTYERLRSRLRRALRALIAPRRAYERDLGVSRWRMVRAHLRRYRERPDGVLDGGSIITHWEETGEYLQLVQPSVGALVADLMDAHPDLPQVKALAAELQRINDGYRDRVAAEADAADRAHAS